MISCLIPEPRTLGGKPPAMGRRFRNRGFRNFHPDPPTRSKTQCYIARTPSTRINMDVVANTDNEVMCGLEAEAELADRMKVEVSDDLEVKRWNYQKVRVYIVAVPHYNSG